MVKMSDDNKAKLRIWAAEPKVMPLPRAQGLPSFGCKRFSSPEEMNGWKRELLAEVARRGGVRWTN